ncbi:MAG: hypothetical protein FWH59_01245 [Lentimicrobiaceae bacterium]|nr:hypothetical protein [Lentimicrobiaceae bacterium]
MEKPTGVIQKIIESLQQINTLDVYSPIEKDIILHNLRAAYMIFLNIQVQEQSNENRVKNLFVEETETENEELKMENGEWKMENEELKMENGEWKMENEELKMENGEWKMENEELKMENEELKMENEEWDEEDEIETEIEENENFVSEIDIEVPLVDKSTTESPLFLEAPLVEEKELILQDDILEFIPDAKPNKEFLFEDTSIQRPEKKSLNDLLTEKKEEQSLGARFQQSFIPDLTKAIAINEKFTFIRELFRNSGVDFSNAIQKLNECGNIDAAFVLMEDLKHQYLWDTTSTAYLTLCDLVRRRFL